MRPTKCWPAQIPTFLDGAGRRPVRLQSRRPGKRHRSDSHPRNSTTLATRSKLISVPDNAELFAQPISPQPVSASLAPAALLDSPAASVGLSDAATSRAGNVLDLPTRSRGRSPTAPRSTSTPAQHNASPRALSLAVNVFRRGSSVKLTNDEIPLRVQFAELRTRPACRSPVESDPA